MLLEEAGYDKAAHNRKIAQIKGRGYKSIHLIIEALADAYCCLYDLEDSSEINNGMCEDFAEDLMSLLVEPEMNTIWLDELSSSPYFPAHKVLLYKGKYFDSECPDGVVDWKDLPICKRSKYFPNL